MPGLRPEDRPERFLVRALPSSPGPAGRFGGGRSPAGHVRGHGHRHLLRPDLPGPLPSWWSSLPR